MEVTTRAERQAMAQVFQQFDKDNSGTMDVSELSLALEHLGIYVEEDQLNELVLQVEVNEENEIFLDGFGNLISLLKGAARYQLVGSSLRTKSGEYLQKALETKLLSSDAIWRFFFDGVVMFTAYVLSIVVVLDSVIPVPTVTLVVEIVAAVVFLLDILVSACTYRDRDDFWYTVKQYGSTWLIPDVFAMLPWGLIIPGTVGKVGRYVNWALKMAKGPYLWKNSDKSVMTEQYINYYFKVLPISLLIALFGFMVHVFTVVFVYIKQNRGEPNFTYDEALYFVIYTLCTVGFGDPPVIGDSIEQLYACAVLCGAIFCNGYIIATFVTILQRADIHQDRRGKLRETLAVLEHFSMPPALQDEVLQFQDHLLGHSLSSAYASVVEGLPQEMRNNIDVAVKLRMVDTAPFFAALHDLLRIALAKELVNAVAKPEQNLFVQGESSRNMVFISHGLVDLIHRGGVQHTKLRTGQYFGVSTLLAREKEILITTTPDADLEGVNDDEQQRNGKGQNHNNHNLDETTGNNNDQQQDNNNNTNNINKKQHQQVRYRRIFPKHTVSAKAVSYCDLWTLKGSTVIAMSKRFVQLRILIYELHEEFKVNPFIFNCVLPPESMFQQAQNNNKQGDQENNRNNNNKNLSNSSASNTPANGNSAPLTPTTVIYHNNNPSSSSSQAPPSAFNSIGNNNNENANNNHNNQGNNNSSLQKNSTAVYDGGNDEDKNLDGPQEDNPAPKVQRNSISGANNILGDENNNHNNPSPANPQTPTSSSSLPPKAPNATINNKNNNNNSLQQQASLGNYNNFNFDEDDEEEDDIVNHNEEDPFNSSTGTIGSSSASSTRHHHNHHIISASSPNGANKENSGGLASSNSHSGKDNNNTQIYVQTVDSLPTNVRVHSLTERLHICHARVRMLLGVIQQNQQQASSSSPTGSVINNNNNNNNSANTSPVQQQHQQQ